MRTIVGVAASLLLCLVVALPAFAHVLQQDRGIAAILHIEPDDDDVVVGQPTHLTLDFGASRQGFDLGTCGCSLSVNRGDHRVAQVMLVPEPHTLTVAKPTVLFPVVGTYQLVVRGVHPQFTLVYAITAAGPGLEETLEWGWLAIATVGVLAAGYYGVHHYAVRYKAKLAARGGTGPK